MSRRRNRNRDSTYTQPQETNHRHPSVMGSSGPPPIPSYYHKYPYHEEIRKIMFVFGAAESTPPNSAFIVEEHVRRYVIQFMFKIAKIAKQNQKEVVSLEDFFFYFRNDPFRIERIQESLKYSLSHIRNLNEFKKRNRIIQSNKWKKEFRKRDLILSFGEFGNETKSTTTSDASQGDNINVDDPNNNNNNNNNDHEEEEPSFYESFEIQKERKEFQEEKEYHSHLVTVNLTSEEFSKYRKESKTTFISKMIRGNLVSTLEKFCKWIDYRDLKDYNVKFEKSAIEALGAIAYDEVGRVTLTSLLVQKNMQLTFQDQFEVSKGIETRLLSMQERKQMSFIRLEDDDPKITNTASMRTPLKPSQVLEGIRRMTQYEQSKKMYSFNH